MRVAIELADMTHERGKRARVGIACGAAERRQPFGAAAVEKLDTREPLRVQLYPSRHITRIRILPARGVPSKPAPARYSDGELRAAARAYPCRTSSTNWNCAVRRQASGRVC